MKYFLNTLRRPSHRLARRLRNARPGSVLILVVALLVLMSLIGTAWLTTARTDRYSARQNTFNTQVDLLLQAVVALAESSVRNDVYSPDGNFRLQTGTGRSDYEPYDASSRDTWLAARVPYRPTDLPPLPATPSPIRWLSISASPVSGSNTSDFEAPYATSDVVANVALPAKYQDYKSHDPILYPVPPFPVVPISLIPSFIDVPVAGGGTTRFPAFGRSIDVDNDIEERFLAADADGDGIADSGLFRMPVGNLDGLTYYGAMRIVDNNSAVNLSTAMTPHTMIIGAGSGAPAKTPDDIGRAYARQFFPTNISLDAILRPFGGQSIADQINGLNAFRLNRDPADDQSLTTPTIDAFAYNDADAFPKPARGDMIFFDPRALAARGPEFELGSLQQKVWKMLGRRLANPGYGGPDLEDRFQAPSVDETVSLARQFVIAPTQPTPLEENYRLGQSLHSADMQTKPYNLLENPLVQQTYFRPASTIIERWFNENFDYDNPQPPLLGGTNGAAMPARPIAVTRNPVATAMPGRLNYRGAYSALQPYYDFGDYVKFPDGRTYVALISNGTRTTAPLPYSGPVRPTGDPTSDLIWAVMPWSDQPLKASINTAGFAELMMAYYSVMNEGSGANPAAAFGVNAETTPPRLRRHFRNPIRDPGYAGGLNGNPAGSIQLLQSEVIKLRAAIAAVNAMDLRDTDRNVTSRTILLRAYTALGVTSFVEVTVYGHEPQPFITEVYVNNYTPIGPYGVNPEGYVAVELYNPHTINLDISGWTLGIIDRRRVALTRATPPVVPAVPADPYPNARVRPIPGFAGFPVGTVINARSHLILENFSGPPDVAPGPRDASYRPPSTNLDTNIVPLPGGLAAERFYVPNLSQVMRNLALPVAFPGGELVLLRPRREDGVLIDHNYPGVLPQFLEVDSANVVGTPAAEELKSASLADMVPVDSFDFTEFYYNVLAFPPVDGTYRVWHYTREHGPLLDEWKFVYPGRWEAPDPTDPVDSTPWAGRSVDLATEIPNYVYHQEGTRVATVAIDGSSPWDAAEASSATTPILLGDNAVESTYVNNFPPVQLHAAGWGPKKPSADIPTDGPNSFPFGGFARNGDILQVPFIGAYRIKLAGAIPAVGILEMNAITMDSIFAHDADTDYPAPPLDTEADYYPAVPPNDPLEMLGRFCPIQAPGVTEDLKRVSAIAAPAFPVSYSWAKDIFDCLTVDSPQGDYMPDVSPELVDNEFLPTNIPQQEGPQRTLPAAAPAFSDETSGIPINRKYITSSSLVPPPPPPGGPDVVPEAVANSTPGQANNGTEDRIGVNGLININTASWKVLSAVPFFGPTVFPDAAGNPLESDPTRPGRHDTLAYTEGTPGVVGVGGFAAGPNGISDNIDLAKAIVYFRDIDSEPGTAGIQTPHGAFTSLFDLNLVLGFQTGGGRFTVVGDQNNEHGDLSPLQATAPPVPSDGVPGDFEARFMMVNRVSNLLTVRSDTFTVYVQVQGWRGIGTTTPELVVQRRAAFIADRNGLSETNKIMSTINVPTD
jgi:hypothetical protein